MSRVCTDQPYLSTAVWNSPLASTGVTYKDPRPKGTSNPQVGLTPASGQVARGSPIGMQLDSSNPSLDIYTQADPGGAQTICTKLAGSAVLATVPMDANFIVPAPSPDNLGITALKMTGTPKVWDGHTYVTGAQFARCAGYAYATVGKWRDNNDSLKGDGLHGDTGASHLPINAGVVKIGELVPGGVIPHALQLILQSRDLYNSVDRTQTWRFPASTSDGYYHQQQKPGGMVYAGLDPALTMGVLMALPPSFDINARLTSEPGKILARALQDFGGYCTNTIGGANTFCIEVSGQGIGTYDHAAGVGDVQQEFIDATYGFAHSVHGGSLNQTNNSTTPWALDCVIIFAALKIVDSQDNNTPSNAYNRVLNNYGTTHPVGAGWDGVTGTAALAHPRVSFPDDFGGTTTWAVSSDLVALASGKARVTLTAPSSGGKTVLRGLADRGQQTSPPPDPTYIIPTAYKNSVTVMIVPTFWDVVQPSVTITSGAGTGSTSLHLPAAAVNANLVVGSRIALHDTGTPAISEVVTVQAGYAGGTTIPISAVVNSQSATYTKAGYAGMPIVCAANGNDPSATSPVDGALASIASGAMVANLKLRFYSGNRTPVWACCLDGNPYVAEADGNGAAMMPRWWTQNFRTAWRGMITGMAALYDSNADIAEVCVDRTMDSYPEVMQRHYERITGPTCTTSGTTVTAASDPSQSSVFPGDNGNGGLAAGMALVIVGTGGTPWQGWVTAAYSSGTSVPVTTTISGPTGTKTMYWGETITLLAAGYDSACDSTAASAYWTTLGGGGTPANAQAEWGLAGASGGEASIVLASKSVTHGNTLMVSAASYLAAGAPTANTPSKTAGTATIGSWTLVGGYSNNNMRTELWSAPVTGDGTITITVTPSTTAGVVASCWEMQGTGVLDVALQQGHGTSAAPSVASGSPTTQSGELVFALVSWYAVETLGSPTFSAITSPVTGTLWQQSGVSHVSLQTFWEVSGGVGTQGLSGTLTSTTWTAMIVTYKSAGGGGGITHGVPITNFPITAAPVTVPLNTPNGKPTVVQIDFNTGNVEYAVLSSLITAGDTTCNIVSQVFVHDHASGASVVPIIAGTDRYAMLEQIYDIGVAWPTTTVSQAHTPYQCLEGTAVAPANGGTDEPWTEYCMAQFRASWGTRGVVKNFSIRDPNLGGGYTSMYAKMVGLGTPIAFQTAASQANLDGGGLGAAGPLTDTGSPNGGVPTCGRGGRTVSCTVTAGSPLITVQTGSVFASTVIGGVLVYTDEQCQISGTQIPANTVLHVTAPTTGVLWQAGVPVNATGSGTNVRTLTLAISTMQHLHATLIWARDTALANYAELPPTNTSSGANSYTGFGDGSYLTIADAATYDAGFKNNPYPTGSQVWDISGDLVAKASGTAAVTSALAIPQTALLALASGTAAITDTPSVVTPPVQPTVGLLPTRRRALIETVISQDYVDALLAATQVRVITKAEIWLGGKRLATFQVLPGNSSFDADRANPCRRTASLALTEGMAVDDQGRNVPVVASNLPDAIGATGTPLAMPTRGASVLNWRLTGYKGGKQPGVIGPSPSSVFVPYGEEIVLWSGVQFPNGRQEWIRMLTGPLEDVLIADTSPNLVITLNAFDRAKDIQRAGFITTFQTPRNTEIGQAIKAILAQCNLPFPLVYKFADSGVRTPSTPIISHPGDDAMQAITDLAASCGFAFYFDQPGAACFLPIPNPAKASIAWGFLEGSNNTLVEADRSFSRTNAFNYHIRIGSGTGAAVPVTSKFPHGVDNVPASPTYWKGQYGRHVNATSSPLITTQVQADTAADASLLVSQGSLDAITLTSMPPRPDSDIDNVVAVTRARAGLRNELYVYDSFHVTFGSAGKLVAKARAIGSIVGVTG